jgi:hypothetical protein
MNVFKGEKKSNRSPMQKEIPGIWLKPRSASPSLRMDSKPQIMMQIDSNQFMLKKDL